MKSIIMMIIAQTVDHGAITIPALARVLRLMKEAEK